MGSRRGFLDRGVLTIWTVLFAAAALTFAAAATTTDRVSAQTTGTWQQVGQDIDAQADEELAGTAVAMSADGNTVIIGAPDDDTDPGTSRIYQLNGTTWQQVGQAIDGEGTLDGSGGAVAMSADGNTVIIGAVGNLDNGTLSGHARVYELNGTTWQQVGQDIDGEAAFDFSGRAVAMSADGNTVIIGAESNDGNGSNSGHVRIYELIGNTWQQVGQDIDGENVDDRSGGAVAMSADGSTVIIGATDNDGNGTDSGHARIYQLNGNTWQQIGQDIDGENAGDESGTAVGISADGNTVIIGARRHNNFSGRVRIYNFNGTNWLQVGQDIDGENVDDRSGGAVAMSADGETVIIGARFNDGNGTRSGHARIYQLNGNTWQQIGQDIDGENAGDESGTAVGISADGNTVIIGARLADAIGFGHARVYELAIPSGQTCNGLQVTVDLGAGQSPTVGDDVILGTSGSDTIVALTGNDTICGLGGDDTINAGNGNDFVDAGDGNDTVFGLDGDDTINGGNGNDTVISGNGNDTVNAGQGNDTLNGGPGDDTLLGAANDDTIFGAAGNDTISGNDGDDFVVGANGDDIISGGTGNDTLNGGNNDDTINGGAGNDTLFGLGGNDVLLGSADGDIILGQLGNDFINGGPGNDTLVGNNGNDIINDPSGTNSLNGGAGNDTLNGGTGNDEIYGDANVTQAGNDTLTGNAGSDLLIGFAGNDTINADDGGTPDTVNGGPHTTSDTCTTDATDTVFNCNP